MRSQWITTKQRIIVALCMIGFIATTVVWTATKAEASINSVVLEGHGFIAASGCTNAVTTFPAFQTVMASQGDTRVPVGINWACSDKGGLDIKPYGRDPNPQTWQANKPIEEIGYALAWAVYDNYTSKGISVSMVCHSMCGLYWRYAVTHSGVDADFPPALLVDQTVTYSTPYKGWDVNPGLMSVTCGSYVQCTEMKPGSAFLTALAAQPAVPRWSCIGGGPGDTVTTIASACGVPAEMKLDYYSKTPVNYNHSSYMADSSTLLNMPLKLNGVAYANQPHSLLSGWRLIARSS